MTPCFKPRPNGFDLSLKEKTLNSWLETWVGRPKTKKRHDLHLCHRVLQKPLRVFPFSPPPLFPGPSLRPFPPLFVSADYGLVCVCQHLSPRFCVSCLICEQGATGVPEERWPTKTSSATRANVPAELVACCSRCVLLSWWFMYGSMVKGYCVC